MSGRHAVTASGFPLPDLIRKTPGRLVTLSRVKYRMLSKEKGEEKRACLEAALCHHGSRRQELLRVQDAPTGAEQEDSIHPALPSCPLSPEFLNTEFSIS